MYDTLRKAMLDGDPDRAVQRWAAASLEDVAAGRLHITAVRHPLGFICFPLEREDGRGVCVHLWTRRLVQASPTTSTTHAHSWDLVSLVLYGALRNELVEISDDSKGAPYRLFEVATGPDGDKIRWTGRLVHRTTKARDLYRAGDVYSMPAGVFHHTTSYGETATVALGSGHPGAVDLVLGGLDTVTHGVRRELCGRDETRYVATFVAERLAAVRRTATPGNQFEHAGS